MKPKKDIAEEVEQYFSTLGEDADIQQFEDEDYTGPSWNVFTEGWNWLKRKLHGKAH